MLDLDKELQTRDGRRAVLVEYGSKSIFAIQKTGGGWELQSRLAGGLMGDHRTNCDIINKPQSIKLTGFLNVYENGDNEYWPTMEGAKGSFPKDETKLAIVDLEALNITITVGDGIDG